MIFFNFLFRSAYQFFIIFLLVFGLVSNRVQAQIVINEGSNKNYSVKADEDNEYKDWIEIYNNSNDSVSLLNYSLTDDISLPSKWTFPNIKLAPHGYRIIYCSEKNRKPISSFTEVLNTSSFNPTTGWNTHIFSRPFYWDGVSNLLINTCTYRASGYTSNSIFNQTTTTYQSTVFAGVDDNESACSVLNGTTSNKRPNMKINGQVVGTGNYNNSGTDFPAPYGNWYWSAKNQMIIPAAELIAAGLTAGNITSLGFDVVSTDPNTVYTYLIINMKLAVENEVSNTFQQLNNDLNLHTNFTLKGKGETIYLFNPTGQQISSMYVDCIKINSSKGSITDAAASSVFFPSPTPGTSNNSSIGYTSILQQPLFSKPAGIFSGAQTITITNPNTIASTIHYTLDGSDPLLSSPSYNGVPISFSTSTVLKAACFSAGQISSLVSTASYLIGISHTTPVLSVVTANNNLYGSTGIFDNWQKDWERIAHAEYFNTDQSMIFSQPTSIQIDGGAGGSRSHPQHSFRLELDNSVLGGGTVYYPLLPDKPSRNKYSRIYLRNGSNQYLRIPYKDACGVKVLSDETNNYYSAYRPVSVYINGSYFGLYELREKFDTEFFKESDGADSCDLLSQSYWYGGVLRAINGTVDSFYAARAAFERINPADNNFWNKADRYFDLKYYTDYIIAESFIHNTDWPYNNIKIYRSAKTNWRYRFCVIDVELSLAPFGWSSSNDDPISFLFRQDPNIPSINVWLRSIQNNSYKRYFINRYADILNTSYLPGVLAEKEDKLYTEMAREMPKEYQRWGNPNSVSLQMTAFNVSHLTLKSEYTSRGQKVRNFIKSGFNLQRQVEVTLDAYPAGAGKVRISTIMPSQLPWKGIYFNGNPVEIEAVANPGYTFLYWEKNALITQLDTSKTLEFDIPSDITFKAIFADTPFGFPKKLGADIRALIYPNPGNGLFSVFLNDVEDGNYDMQITNTIGQFIGSYQINVTARKGIVNPDLTKAPSGMYLIRITRNRQSWILKYLKTDN